MGTRRQLVFWMVLALAATTLFVFVLVRQHQRARARVVTFLAGDPRNGGSLFQRRGCANCHAVHLLTPRRGADVQFERPRRPSLNQLVTSMWNHAPRMWERMKERKIAVPSLSEGEVSDIFAFLYVAQYADEPGDSARGGRLFESKGCVRCHAVAGRGGTRGPDISKINGIDTPIAWTQAMWNHAPAMSAGMQQVGLSWPRFEGSEMNDLLAYVREACSAPRAEAQFLPANPGRGWNVFRAKSCVVCHAVQGEGGHLAPELGPQRNLPRTLVQFAGAMWNHSPEMYRAMKEKNIERPQFKGQEMADLMAFLHSLRYFEPTGSQHVGATIFSARACARCHGEKGEGTNLGPGLRGRGDIHSSISIATALWRHGPNMYRRTQKLGLPWPTLEENDIGNLVAFLNAPPEEAR